MVEQQTDESLSITNRKNQSENRKSIKKRERGERLERERTDIK
jgi:hypothetical protein